MPEIGEIKRANQIGYKGNLLYTWQACGDCGEMRWIRLKFGEAMHNHCRNCAQRHIYRIPTNHPVGSKNCPYNLVRIKLDDFFYPMVRKDGCVFEHRLVMAKHLQRCLLPWEVVHHRNGIKKDNRLENLELLRANSRHNKLLNKEIKKLQRQVKELQGRVTLLEAELTITRLMNKEIEVLHEPFPKEQSQYI